MEDRQCRYIQKNGIRLQFIYSTWYEYFITKKSNLTPQT